jgi:hypothetical protein
MPTLKHSPSLALSAAAILLVGCAKTDKPAGESADPEGLTPADVSGKWSIRAVPFSGDTTPTMSILTATGTTDGWTLTFPNRPPLATRVKFDGDSVTTDTGPYESVRRKGVQVRTNTTVRLDGDSLVGTTVARYAAQGVDSVTRFRVTGHRAP